MAGRAKERRGVQYCAITAEGSCHVNFLWQGPCCCGGINWEIEILVQLCSNLGLEYEGGIFVVGMYVVRIFNQRLCNLRGSFFLDNKDISRRRWPEEREQIAV